MIKIKFIQKGQPGVVGGGVKKYYAQIDIDGESTIDDIVKEIEKFSALSEADIRGVIIALENVVQNKLAEGRIVRLEMLGSLYPSISSKSSATLEKADSSLVKEVNINYRPGTRLKKVVNEAGFLIEK
jgi:predicted histone-like DNA-binding protein